MSKHTPKPWEVVGPFDDGGYVITEGQDGYTIASVRSDDNASVVRPDAYLIAAAPDLLEACKALLGPDVLTGDEPFDPVSMALRAIAKAQPVEKGSK